jgi:hypothetical protein
MPPDAGERAGAVTATSAWAEQLTMAVRALVVAFALVAGACSASGRRVVVKGEAIAPGARDRHAYACVGTVPEYHVPGRPREHVPPRRQRAHLALTSQRIKEETARNSPISHESP